MAETLGTRLRELRESKGWGLREVAKKASVNHGYLSQLERGDVSEPAPAILQRLAPAYGVPFPVLMEWAGYIESGISANQQRALSYLGDDVTDTELELLQAFLDAIRKQSATYNPHARLDGHLPDTEIERIRAHVVSLLQRADALGLVPTPIDQVLDVARLVSTGEIQLDPDEQRKLRRRFGDLVDRAWERLQGVIHFGPREIWVNPEMYPLRKRFVLGHEIGHDVLPEHRETFAYLDDAKRLRPDVHDLYERQANQASIELLAQGDRLRAEADDSTLSMAVVDGLATRFEISVQATGRRIVEETKQECALAMAFRAGYSGRLSPYHLYCSRSFEQRFRWKATGCASKLIWESITGARRSDLLEPTVVTDTSGRAASVAIDAICTPRAVLVLFRAAPVSRLKRLISAV